MLINWFGKTYYGDKKQFKRPIKHAFDLWFSEYILRIRYKPDGKGHWIKYTLWKNK
jgi:hypothetical protein